MQKVEDLRAGRAAGQQAAQVNELTDKIESGRIGKTAIAGIAEPSETSPAHRIADWLQRGPRGIEYTVAPGDTFSGIMEKIIVNSGLDRPGTSETYSLWNLWGEVIAKNQLSLGLSDENVAIAKSLAEKAMKGDTGSANKLMEMVRWIKPGLKIKI